MRLRALLVSTAAAAATALLATPAMAATSVSWGPLRSYYKGIQRSYSYGTFFVDRATYATAKVYLNDTSNDGNTVYTDADEYFYGASTSCGLTSDGHPVTCWAYDRRKQSPEYTYTNTPVVFSMYNSLHAQADRARAAVHTYAQMGWPVPDQCSPDAIATIDY